MRIILCRVIVFACLLGMAGMLHAGAVPREVAGFVLGEEITKHKDRLLSETALPTRHFESLYEVEIKPLAGFKSGLIEYGTCEGPDRILRIKLKYQNSRKKFYDELLRRFKKRFGKPDDWRGDPFHVMVAWKWSFKNANGDRISLILQHNIADEQQKQGNVVKLSNTSAMAREHQCFVKTQAPSKGKARPTPGAPDDWQNFIPR